MHRRHASAILLVVLSAQLLSGCFAHQPIPAPGVTAVTDIRVRFAVPTAVHIVDLPTAVQNGSLPVVSTTITGVELVDARSARMTGDTVRLERIQRLDAPGRWSHTPIEQASFLSSDSVSYSALRFSPARTAVAALGIGALLTAFVGITVSSMQWRMHMQ
jgi:hypothetical protein